MQKIERQHSTLNYVYSDLRETPNRCLSMACIIAVQELALLKAQKVKPE